MKELTTDFIRMWQHCPVQASWCSQNELLPVGLLARRCMAMAVGDSCPNDSRSHFQAMQLKNYFDVHWTAVQSQTNKLSLETFLETGKKYLAMANTIAALLNRMIDEGWRVAGGNYELAANAAEVLRDDRAPFNQWRIVHHIDCLLRDPVGVLNLVSLHLSRQAQFANHREVSRSTENMLNNVMARQCLDETVATAILSTTRNRLVQSGLADSDHQLATSLIKSVIQGIENNAVTHAVISELNCGWCPVQELCDDPISYRKLTITQEVPQ